MIKNIFSFILDPKNTRMFLLAIVLILIGLLFKECKNSKEAAQEIVRIKNNIEASNDVIKYHVNKEGQLVAEIQALTLTVDELRDSLKFEKNKPPVTIIEYRTKIVEKIVEVPVYITVVKDTTFDAILHVESTDSWGNSSRQIKVDVPYSLKTDTVEFNNATINLTQDIWFNSSILVDKKTKKAYVNLTTDYPNATFNGVKGIVVDHNTPGFKELTNQYRKEFGIGIHAGYGLTSSGFSPYIGLGLTYTPKFLQW